VLLERLKVCGYGATPGEKRKVKGKLMGRIIVMIRDRGPKREIVDVGDSDRATVL